MGHQPEKSLTDQYWILHRRSAALEIDLVFTYAGMDRGDLTTSLASDFIAVFILPGGGIKTRHAWQSSASILHPNFLSSHCTYYSCDFRRVNIVLRRRDATKKKGNVSCILKYRDRMHTIATLLTANF